jgi:CRISPR locus-related DNA-binding protein
MKVHILITGWDCERSIWGCMHLGADRVYLIVPDSKPKRNIETWVSQKTKNVAESVMKKYSKYFEINPVTVSYEDYLDCFRKIIRIMKKEAKNEVFVNISSGSHVVASAAIFAASIMRCKAYYVLAERYDDIFKDEGRFVSYGGKSVVDVPLLPISFISDTETEILKIIKKDGRMPVSELARKANHLFSKPTRSNFNYYVNKLAESGFLKNEISSGKMFTRITESGKMIIEALT